MRWKQDLAKASDVKPPWAAALALFPTPVFGVPVKRKTCETAEFQSTRAALTLMQARARAIRFMQTKAGALTLFETDELSEIHSAVFFSHVNYTVM